MTFKATHVNKPLVEARFDRAGMNVQAIVYAILPSSHVMLASASFVAGQ